MQTLLSYSCNCLRYFLALVVHVAVVAVPILVVILTDLSSGAGEVVGHPVQPFPGVLADVAIVPIHHYTKHVALRIAQTLGK